MNELEQNRKKVRSIDDRLGQEKVYLLENAVQGDINCYSFYVKMKEPTGVAHTWK